MNNKVVVVGCGNVGMSYAYALINQSTKVSELVLIDINKERSVGEAMDLNHCLFFAPNPMVIKAGDYSDCSDASLVVIAAGANQKPGETRMDLIKKNSLIFKEIVSSVVGSGFNGIFLVATNPLDVMTYLTWKYSGFDNSRIIGSGTCLDTSRLRYLVSKKLDIAPNNIHAYVIGEHGDSEFVAWSSARVGLQSIDEYLALDEEDEISEEVKNAAYEIINRKGATYYGIGMALVEITDSIFDNKNSILTVSCYNEEEDIFIGMPAVINSNGVSRVLRLDLDSRERIFFNNSVGVIKNAIKEII